MSLDGLFTTFNNKLEAPVRTHLKSVYACLTMSILSAATGAYVHLFTDLLRGGGILYALASLGLIFALHSTPDNGKNRGTRLGMLLGFAFLTGLGTGPILEMALLINPSIIPTAFLMSATIFAAFSGAALFAPDGKYLFLGGTLMSGLTTLFWLGLLNIFFQSQLVFQAYLWGGLFLFCGFIVWDTQMIIEKRRRGDGDYISHSVELFLDFVQVFRKIVIILSQKEERDKKKNKD